MRLEPGGITLAFSFQIGTQGYFMFERLLFYPQARLLTQNFLTGGKLCFESLLLLEL